MKASSYDCSILHLPLNLQRNEVFYCGHRMQQNPSAVSLFSAKAIISFHARSITSSAGHLSYWNHIGLLYANNILIFLLYWPDFFNFFVIFTPTSVFKNCDSTL